MSRQYLPTGPIPCPECGAMDLMVLGSEVATTTEGASLSATATTSSGVSVRTEWENDTLGLALAYQRLGRKIVSLVSVNVECDSCGRSFLYVLADVWPTTPGGGVCTLHSLCLPMDSRCSECGEKLFTGPAVNSCCERHVDYVVGLSLS